MAGVYGGDRTFDISGIIHEPIRIAAGPGAAAEIRAACWFFYDVSDVIVSGLTFRDAPSGAVSVIGACNRNRFGSLRFIDCGMRDTTSCTLFFGGSGGNCNVVESCRFEHEAAGETKTMRVGLMVSEGDGDGGAPITDHVFRKNHFVNYDYGILVGAGDAPASQYGHIVELNTVEQCGTAGILIKCGDTTVRNNRVVKCTASGIAVAAGRASAIESNRIFDCGTGIQVNGDGHTVANNFILRCGGEGIGINGEAKVKARRAASNIIVENNTCVGCGSAGVRIDAGATAIVRRNLFSGEGKPCAGAEVIRGRKNQSLIIENMAADGCAAMEGAAAGAVAFKNADSGDFTNDSGFGAAGAVLTPETFEPENDTVDEADSIRCSYGALDDEESEEPGAESAETAEPTAEDFEGFMNRFYSKNVP
jgi:hypothetical protein